MSKADKMFEDLGYKKEIWDDWIVFVHKKENYHVQFHLNDGIIHTPLTDWDVSRNHYTLFLAIFEKMKELGWIND